MKLSHIAIPMLSGVLLLAIPQVNKANQVPTSESQQSLMTRIREFIGTQPRSVSVGGTRSAMGKQVCLLSPGPIRQSSKGSEILVVNATPDLVLGSKLNQIEIRSRNKVLWSEMGTSKKAIDGRISWPITPIKPRQRLQLGLRPRGTAGGDWARITLVGASRAAMKTYQKTLKTSSGSSTARLIAVNSAVKAKDQSKALALLWAPLPSSDRTMKQLRADALASCP